MNLNEIPLEELKRNPLKYAKGYTNDQLLDAFNLAGDDQDRKKIITEILELRQEIIQQSSNKKPERGSWWDINKIINWDFDVALDYLEKHCRDIDDRLEWYWKPFNKVTIKLPKTNWFNWNELVFYVETWDWNCDGKKFEENNCRKYSFSKKDIKNIKNSVKEFLISVWIDPYEKVDTFDKKYVIDRSEICIQRLLWLEENGIKFNLNGEYQLYDEKWKYRLKDKIIGLFGFRHPDYYQLASRKNGLIIEKWFYDWWDFRRNDTGKLLFRSRPNEENQK